MSKLSILIPARNEPFLQRTIAGILDNTKGDTDIWVGLDGCMYGDGSIEKNFPDLDLKRVVMQNNAKRLHFYVSGEKKGQGLKPLGQRAMTNVLARAAKKWSKPECFMKVDAHCSFSRSFDVEMMDVMDDRTILAPILLPLEPFTWTINGKKKMTQFVFDTEFVMQHAEGDVGDTMCLQGSAWMVGADNYWKWDLGDETMPSWGGQGVELGIKAFLNGGRCRTTASAYYGHVFRQSNEEFPYDRGENPGKEATEELRRRYLNKVAQLVEKFNYPADWSPQKVDELCIDTK